MDSPAICGVRRSAWGAAIVTCALLSSAYGLQVTPGPDTSTKSTDKTSPTKSTAKPATKTSSHVHHTATSASAKSSGTTHHTASSKKHSSHSKKSARARGQQKIDSERAEAIQEALIREHYLSGEPAGTWNQASEEAMRRYQGDHGWQTKEVPDSRALISLGLGPSKDHLLNPESAMTSGPDTSTAKRVTIDPAPQDKSTTTPPSTPGLGHGDTSVPQ